jgi:hypothetical protein
VIPAISFCWYTSTDLEFMCCCILYLCNDLVLSYRDAEEVDNERKELEEV